MSESVEPAGKHPVQLLTGNFFPDTTDPVLRAVSRWLDDVCDDVPDPVRRRGALAAINWLVGPALNSSTNVVPRF